jgi:hypothetical protein
MAKKQITKLSELTPDAHNYNKGTEFGGGLIEKSLRKLGAGRSILLDKNGKVIAGNKTLENAVNAGFGDEDLIVVQTTGKQIVAVQRMDLDLDSRMGKEMALADNATAKANIDWDTDALAADWNSDELDGWGVRAEWGEEKDKSQFDETAESYLNSQVRQIVLYYDQVTHKRVLDIFAGIGVKYDIDEDNSAVVLKLVEFYESKNS